MQDISGPACFSPALLLLNCPFDQLSLLRVSMEQSSTSGSRQRRTTGGGWLAGSCSQLPPGRLSCSSCSSSFVCSHSSTACSPWLLTTLLGLITTQSKPKPKLAAALRLIPWRCESLKATSVVFKTGSNRRHTHQLLSLVLSMEDDVGHKFCVSFHIAQVFLQCIALVVDVGEQVFITVACCHTPPSSTYQDFWTIVVHFFHLWLRMCPVHFCLFWGWKADSANSFACWMQAESDSTQRITYVGSE